jgi:hypothetical protein
MSGRQAAIALQQHVAILEQEAGSLRAELAEKTEEITRRRLELAVRPVQGRANVGARVGIGIALVAAATGIAYVGTRPPPSPAVDCPRTEVPAWMPEERTVARAWGFRDDTHESCSVVLSTVAAGAHTLIEDVTSTCGSSGAGRIVYRSGIDPDPRGARRDLAITRSRLDMTRADIDVDRIETWREPDGSNGGVVIDSTTHTALFRTQQAGEPVRSWTVKLGKWTLDPW